MKKFHPSIEIEHAQAYGNEKTYSNENVHKTVGNLSFEYAVTSCQLERVKIDILRG
jgi:hypothetical protein